jgi:hypothetical protein
MKYLNLIMIFLIASFVTLSCNKEPKVMSPKDFLKIENEVLTTDLSPEVKEKIAKKYGYTLKQYLDFEEQAENDPELKKKLGEESLKNKK